MKLKVGIPFSCKSVKTYWYRYQDGVVMVNYEFFKKPKLVRPGLVSQIGTPPGTFAYGRPVGRRK